MAIIVILIAISLIIAVGFLIAFLWSFKSGQYDDTYSPSVRMLFDTKPKEQQAKAKPKPVMSKRSASAKD
ncbi:MAG: cbb3-type cytochrome oxidase assembly protein CcoS [Cyclobacteriaceae bacterium]|jgi:cbb3-type cytochrome oxidase maturation protein|nr:cbb3-type cytochrome oxidase assembly protein CcoS [Cyclobacteriaceae bacterium]MDH4296576.1 cbb3-type cytochrome oxidase assembly protein CcoS [Cyclobacteriaceae bacterium]MDH5248843.1 cbb3-type cytochrome oxidase assembly protein CcoS [Cyclobacteriaceae bacterium]